MSPGQPSLPFGVGSQLVTLSLIVVPAIMWRGIANHLKATEP
jgi:hypothetical protein